MESANVTKPIMSKPACWALDSEKRRPSVLIESSVFLPTFPMSQYGLICNRTTWFQFQAFFNWFTSCSELPFQSEHLNDLAYTKHPWFALQVLRLSTRPSHGRLKTIIVSPLSSLFFYIISRLVSWFWFPCKSSKIN